MLIFSRDRGRDRSRVSRDIKCQGVIFWIKSSQAAFYRGILNFDPSHSRPTAVPDAVESVGVEC